MDCRRQLAYNKASPTRPPFVFFAIVTLLMRNLFLALIAGLLFPLAFAPYGLWPLLLVSVALAYWVQASAPSAKAALLGGWVYGLGMFGFGVAWLQVSMTDYGYMPLWMARCRSGLRRCASPPRCPPRRRPLYESAHSRRYRSPRYLQWRFRRRRPRRWRRGPATR